MLYSQLHDCSRDLFALVLLSEIKTCSSFQLIYSMFFKKGDLSTVTSRFRDFQKLLLTKRETNEGHRKFEYPLAASIAKLKQHVSNTIPEPITAFSLLVNRTVYASKLISILSDDTSRHYSNIDSKHVTHHELLDATKHGTIASSSFTVINPFLLFRQVLYQ